MADNEKKTEACTYSGIGGQAVMEGVMMRNGDKYAVAVRKQNGEIVIKKDEYAGIIKSKTVYKIPVIRGVFSFIDSLVLGLTTLNFSSDIFMEEPDAEEKPEEEKKGEGAMSVIITVVALIIAMGLFMVIPYFLSQLFKGIVENAIVLSLIEGVIRIIIFIAYIRLISLMKDIKRVFMYHGAEHKCINCIESGMELNVENVRNSSKEHRRCGTSFLLYVMVISIIFFSFIQTPVRILRVVLRIVLIPVIAGVSYEFIRKAGRSSSGIIKILSTPGLWMQALTTTEPDDEMIGVGISSVEAVFDWKDYLNKNFGAHYETDSEPNEKTDQKAVSENREEKGVENTETESGRNAADENESGSEK